MSFDLEAFKDPDLARGLIASIEKMDVQGLSIMEVCGTHTVAIARAGIRSIMPEGTRLISGPGCPVCVTANQDIDRMIALSRIPSIIITTFGDMMRVPGSSSSLLQEKAAGADIRTVYSPLDALDIALENPDRQVVFLGVGFETTIPAIAATVLRAQAQGVANFSIISAHKGVPQALEVLVNDPEVYIDAFILPGHVSTIIGAEPYRFLAERYGIPGVITGFEAVDLLQGIAMLMKACQEGAPSIQIAYTRGVMEQGNPQAMELMDQVFQPEDAVWRGIGPIPGSGFCLRPEFGGFDALRRFEGEYEVEPTVEPKGCRCGDVLRGAITPNDCPLFGVACSPEHPVGPCMVSSEGSCAAYHRYRIGR